MKQIFVRTTLEALVLAERSEYCLFILVWEKNKT